jgi:hypothetical protein
METNARTMHHCAPPHPAALPPPPPLAFAPSAYLFDAFADPDALTDMLSPVSAGSPTAPAYAAPPPPPPPPPLALGASAPLVLGASAPLMPGPGAPRAPAADPPLFALHCAQLARLLATPAPPAPPPPLPGVAAGGVAPKPRAGAVRRTKVRRYVCAKPSRFCHVCARSAEVVALAPCKNVRFGVCRKAVCEKCFVDQGWDWAAVARDPGSFSCCHCRRACPENAQCGTYQKTNERRRVSCLRKRMLIEDALANGDDVETLLQQTDF